MPTATSRMDLSSCKPEVGGKGRASPWTRTAIGTSAILRLRPVRLGKGLSNSVSCAESKNFLDQAELTGFAGVCFTYALGQSLYDMFQSSQVKASTASWSTGRHIAYAISVSAYPLAKVVSSPYIGHLSDRFGRREVMCLTLACTGLSWHVCGSVESFWSLLACRLAMGCVATGGLLTARATDVAANDAQRTRLFSVFTTAWAGARVLAAVVVKLSLSDVRRACRAASVCGYASSFLACVALSVGRRRRPPVARCCVNANSDLPRKHTKPSFRSLAREMLSERLAFLLFVSSLLTPRVDAAAFVSKQFGAGPEAVGSLKAVEAVAVVTVSLVGGGRWLSETSSTAALAALLVSLGWLSVAAAPSMFALYPLVLMRGLFAAVYDPIARSIVFARAKRHEHSGSFVGLQQSLKGASQVSSAWLGAYLASIDVSLPLAVSALCSLANAAAFALDAANEQTCAPDMLIHQPQASKHVHKEQEEDWRAWLWQVGESWRCEQLGPQEKLLWLVCRCQTLRDEEDGVSLGALLHSLRNYMLPSSATDLYGAADRKLPRVLCRAMLIGLRKAMGTAGDVDDDDDGLSASGRLDALKLRLFNANPQLCLVSPDRGSLQTAILALSAKPDTTKVRFVAHDAARPPMLRTNSTALRLEFSQNIDFGSCHDDLRLAKELPLAFDRRVAALLGFLKHRTERRLAIVAQREVLSAILKQAAATSHSAQPFFPNQMRLFKLTFTSGSECAELPVNEVKLF